MKMQAFTEYHKNLLGLAIASAHRSLSVPAFRDAPEYALLSSLLAEAKTLITKLETLEPSIELFRSCSKVSARISEISIISSNLRQETMKRLVEKSIVKLRELKTKYPMPTGVMGKEEHIQRLATYNDKRHGDSVSRIATSFQLYLKTTGRAPSRNQLVKLANCSSTSATNYLRSLKKESH